MRWIKSALPCIGNDFRFRQGLRALKLPWLKFRVLKAKVLLCFLAQLALSFEPVAERIARRSGREPLLTDEVGADPDDFLGDSRAPVIAIGRGGRLVIRGSLPGRAWSPAAQALLRSPLLPCCL